MTAWMLPLAVKATVVLAVALLIALAMRRASASARHAIWTVSLVALLLLPVLAYVVPRWEVAVLPPPLVPAPPPVEMAEIAFPEADPPRPAEVAAPMPTWATPAARPFDWALAIVVAWWLGACLGVLHLALGTVVIALKTRRARPVTDDGWCRSLSDAAARIGLHRAAALRWSDRIAVPMVWGVRRPVILIPADADAWPQERRAAFLMHELAHVARHDCLTQTLAAVAHSLYWPQPLVWWAVARMRREAERACDDRVLAAGTQAPAYAHHLLEAARGLADAPRTFAPASAVIERTSLGDRLLALLDDRRSRRSVTARTLAIAGFGALVLTGVVAALQPVARAAMADVIHAAVAPATEPEPAAPVSAARPIPAASPAPRALATANPAPALTGVVKGAGGKPIEKALVLAWEPLRRNEPPLAARTSRAGEFEIAVPGPAVYVVRVEAPGYAPHVIEKIGTRGLIAVTLVKGASIGGVVRDASTKRPIAGARVTASSEASLRPPTSPSEPDAGLTIATTDKEGRYFLEGVGRGRHHVSAISAGYGSSSLKANAGSTGADVFLHPGAVLTGLVMGPDGKPVAGASIHAACRTMGCPTTPPAFSNDQGRFEIIGLEPGTYQVLARHPQYAPSFVAEASVRLGSTPPVEIRLERGYRVIGRLAGVDGRAARGQVALQSTDGVEVPALLNQQMRGKAEANGRFTLEGLPPGTHSLAVFPIGYPPMSVEATVGGKDPLVDIGDVTLETGMIIRGRIRNAQGAPVAGAAISNVGGSSRSIQLRTESEPDGTFVLAATEKMVYHLVVNAEGYAERSNIDAEPGGPVLDVVLQLGGKIVGTVVDESGRPAPNCRAVARPSERQGTEIRVPNLTDVVSTGGRFEIAGVRAGTFVVLIQAADHVDKTVSDVKVTPGATTDVGKIVLSAGGVVRGVVTDGADAPVAGAHVTVAQRSLRVVGGSGPQNREATTDAAGGFEIRGLPPGVSEIKGRHPRFSQSAPVEVAVDPTAGPAEARITLLRGGTLQGTARRRDGRPVSGAIVHVLSSVSGFNAAGSPVGEDGSFIIERVTPGKVEVALLTGVAGRYNSVMSKAVEVRDGETTPVDMTLMDVRVSGRVTRGGRPVANHQLRFAGAMQMTMSFGGGLGVPPPPSGPPRMETVTGADGLYELLVPAAGKYSVRLEPRGRERSGSPDIPDVAVPDGESFSHDIVLPDWTLSGSVVDKETKQPVSDAMVEARPSAGEPGGMAMTTLADGRFQIAVEPGSYRVRVVAPKFVAHETTMMLGGGAKQETVELVRGGTLKGEVRTAGGQGVEAALVLALSEAGVSVRRTRTSVDGSFAVEGLASGSYLLFAAHDMGFAVQPNTSVRETAADLTLSPGAKVRFVFKDERGAPVAGSQVRADLLKVGDTKVGIEGRDAYGAARRTDSDGAFEMRLPIGAIEVVAWAAERKLRGVASIAVQPQTPDVTIVLKPR